MHPRRRPGGHPSCLLICLALPELWKRSVKKSAAAERTLEVEAATASPTNEPPPTSPSTISTARRSHTSTATAPKGEIMARAPLPLCSASSRPLRNPGQPPRAARLRPRTVVVAAARVSGAEARASLVLALASQALSASQRRAADLAAEAAMYAFPSRRFEPRTLEEALMSVPDLETVPFRVLKREADYEIREVESYFIAETTMPGRSGFDFNGSSQSFNVLASYLFGKNTASEQMEMTTPVFTRKGESNGETMDMTTPVITKKSVGENKWKMSFVMPAKYGSNLPRPKDPSVTIKEVPSKRVAVAAFSGLVTDDDISQRESKLRQSLLKDNEFRVRDDSVVEVAQYNPPFTLPFTRRNEIALEVERKDIVS